MKNIYFLFILTICMIGCKNNAENNTISTEEKAKNEKIRNHFVIVTGELEKFINAEKLNKGFLFEDNYLTSLPYIISYIQQMKKVGYTEYSDGEYQKAFTYALSSAVKNQNSWKKLTYTLASKKHGNISKNQKNVDSLAYFQAGVDIISNEVYASGIEIRGFADLQQFLEKIGVEEKYRTPIDILD